MYMYIYICTEYIITSNIYVVPHVKKHKCHIEYTIHMHDQFWTVHSIAPVSLHLGSDFLFRESILSTSSKHYLNIIWASPEHYTSIIQTSPTHHHIYIYIYIYYSIPSAARYIRGSPYPPHVRFWTGPGWPDLVDWTWFTGPGWPDLVDQTWLTVQVRFSIVLFQICPFSESSFLIFFIVRTALV